MSNGYFEPDEAREGYEADQPLRESSEQETTKESFEIADELFRYFLTRDPKDAARKFASKNVRQIAEALEEANYDYPLMCNNLTSTARKQFPNISDLVLELMCSHFTNIVPEIMKVLHLMQNTESVTSKDEVILLAEEDPYILSLIILGSSGGFIAQNYEARNGNGEVILHPKKDVASDDQITIIAKELKTEGAKKALGRVYSNVKSELRKTFRNSKIENGNLILSTQNSRDFDSDIRKFINAYCIDDETIQLFFEINIITVSVLQNLSAYFSSLESERRLNERIDIHGIKIRFIEILARKYYEIGEQ